MYQQYLTTNQNITQGKNSHIKFKNNGGFTLSTPKQEESDAQPLQQYFPDRHFVPLVEVLATVNRFTHFVDELQHPQQRYHHGKPSEDLFRRLNSYSKQHTLYRALKAEAVHVLDPSLRHRRGLMHNEVVKSDIHSTDAFGFSEMVFAVSHLLAFSYAPRFKNLSRQRLYIFKSRKRADRSAWKIQPAGYADDEIVIQH